MAIHDDAHGTVQGVRDITDTGLETDEIERYINIAYYRTEGLDLSECGGTAALGEVQNFLAAHFITMSRERQVESESIAGEASVTYNGQDGEGLRATTYGQAAIDLDCSGQLAKAGLKKVVFDVYGAENDD